MKTKQCWVYDLDPVPDYESKDPDISLLISILRGGVDTTIKGVLEARKNWLESKIKALPQDDFRKIFLMALRSTNTHAILKFWAIAKDAKFVDRWRKSPESLMEVFITSNTYSNSIADELYKLCKDELNSYFKKYPNDLKTKNIILKKINTTTINPAHKARFKAVLLASTNPDDEKNRQSESLNNNLQNPTNTSSMYILSDYIDEMHASNDLDMIGIKAFKNVSFFSPEDSDAHKRKRSLNDEFTATTIEESEIHQQKKNKSDNEEEKSRALEG